MRLSLSLALMQIAARRVVHVTGTYNFALEETAKAGFLTSTEKRRLEINRAKPAEIATEGGRRNSESSPKPPSTLDLPVELPIDREYLLPSLLEFNDPRRVESEPGFRAPGGRDGYRRLALTDRAVS